MADESYIQLTLEIAKRGTGKVSPNPLVGCVITKNGKIIGAGYHSEFGKDHAEINAINSSREKLDGSALYVNLEPCAHQGNTPPCVDRIIEEKIKKVIIGTRDPNPLVSGKGIKKLKEAGIEVVEGVLKQECEELNRFFFKFIPKQQPFVTLKVAVTLDGKIADVKSNSKWISGPESRKYVHAMRNNYDAVLIGARTALSDDPELTVRYTEGRNPYRIVLDSKLKLPSGLKVFQENSDRKTIVITTEAGSGKKNKLKKLDKLGVNVITVKKNRNDRIHLKSLLRELGRNNITSVMVEGGSGIFTSFIKNKLFDDITIFISPKILGNGIPVVNKLGIESISKSFNLKLKHSEVIGEDILAVFVP